MAEWWKKNSNTPLGDGNFQKIIEFYLFNCPCETEKGSESKGTKSYTRVSKRGVTLRSQGWTGGFLNTLLASMKHTSSGHLEYHTYNSKTDITTEVKNLEATCSLSDPHFEMVVLSERSDMSKTSSIFYYVRNAFAHGSFSVVDVNGERVYYLESAKDDKVKARLRLRETTLLKWIQDFKFSPSVLKSTLAQERKRKSSKSRKKAA